ncbi:MAG: YbbR-like domain-containing protein, partial [Prevotella sp.]
MEGTRKIFHIIRNFLFSSVNREFLVFLFFLALSGIFWLLMTLNENYEKEIRLPVQIVNVPQNVVLTSDSIDTIKVTLNDKGLMIMNYLYGEGIKPLKLNFKTYT